MSTHSHSNEVWSVIFHFMSAGLSVDTFNMDIMDIWCTLSRGPHLECGPCALLVGTHNAGLKGHVDVCNNTITY